MLLAFRAIYTRLRNDLSLFVTTFLNSLSWMAGTLGQCCGLNLKCLLYVRCLNPWSLAGGTIWEDHSLEAMVLCGWAFMFYSPTHFLPSLYFLTRNTS